jgi:nucleoside-diphosphate-sugar epimerase
MKLVISGFNGFVSQSIFNYLKTNGIHAPKVIFLTSDIKNIQIQEPFLIDRIENFFDINSTKFSDTDVYIHACSSPRSRGILRLQDNLNILKKALHACEQNNIKKFIYLSSGAVYADSDKNKSESDSIQCIEKANNDYIKSKLISEKHIINFCLEKNISYNILRLFTFAGKDIVKRKEFAISDFIKSACENKIIKLSNPFLIRSYLHQDDLAAMILKLSLINYWQNDIINIGSPRAISLLDVAKEIADISGSKVLWSEEASRKPENINFYVPNMDKFLLKKMIRFKTLDIMVSEMIHAYELT